MNTSETIDALATALALAQQDMKPAAYNKTNPAFKSRYADLSAIREATLPALNKHGLSIWQGTHVDERGVILVTRLIHKTGQWIESTYPIPLNDKPQIMGSALTYARRYAWSSACGITADDDDDAEAASKAKANGNGATGELISPAQIKTLRAAIAEVEAEEVLFVRYLKIPSLDALPADQYDRAMRALDAKKAKTA